MLQLRGVDFKRFSLVRGYAMRHGMRHEIAVHTGIGMLHRLANVILYAGFFISGCLIAVGIFEFLTGPSYQTKSSITVIVFGVAVAMLGWGIRYVIVGNGRAD
jgi:ABC-type Fe3+ transport system permease subunit